MVLWLNGGPGSSSLIGLLTENGQFRLNEYSLKNVTHGVPQLFYNQYGWTQLANIIYLESPKGVGFSYCEGGQSDCINTDESTAMDSYEFLLNFFLEFPEFLSNEFFIAGESYAGIYIPMLMDQIRKDLLQQPTVSPTTFPTRFPTLSPTNTPTESVSDVNYIETSIRCDFESNTPLILRTYLPRISLALLRLLDNLLVDRHHSIRMLWLNSQGLYTLKTRTSQIEISLQMRTINMTFNRGKNTIARMGNNRALHKNLHHSPRKLL